MEPMTGPTPGSGWLHDSDKIHLATLVDVTYDKLRESILVGKVALGSHLAEVPIADGLGVSRGTVREALARLRRDGLVVQLPRSGCYVRELSVNDIVDVYNARVGLESFALQLAVGDSPDVSTLRDLILEMKTAASNSDVFELSKREMAFHEEIARLSGNVHIHDAFRRLAGAARIILNMDNQGYSDLVIVAEEHEVLISVLEGGSMADAEGLMARHINSSVPNYLRRIASIEVAEKAIRRLIMPDNVSS